jgi:excisionase family DNA binding protein
VGVEKDTTMRDELPDPAIEQQSSESESTYRSVAELAADLALSERTTRDALRRGEIPHIRIGRRFILPKAAIAEWLRTAGGSIAAEQPAAERAKLVACAAPPEVTVMRRTVSR